MSSAGEHAGYAVSIDKKDFLWMEKANCQGTDTESFFIEIGDVYPPSLKRICGECEVRSDCLNYAIKYRMQGFWGGTTEQERRTIKRAKTINSIKPR